MSREKVKRKECKPNKGGTKTIDPKKVKQNADKT